MSDFDSTAATAAAAEEFREQLEQELTIDRLLERPERKYTDVQDLVADFQLEQRRTRETSSSNNADDCCDDDDDDNEQHHHHHDDHHHHQNGSIRNTRSSTAAAPVSDGIVREAVHSSRANAPKTGPKGVKADHEEYVRREYARWQAQQATAEAAAARNTATVRTVREDAVIDSLEQQLRDGVAVEQLLDAEDDDDDFMRTYRAARVAELKANAAAALARRVTFGELIDLDEDAYNAILEESGANVASVVHIFDDQLVACRRLNAKLRLLAARHKRVRFGAFPLATVGGEFDRAALPVMLVYKNSELVESFFNLSTTLGQTSFDENDVARLLGAVGVLELDEIGES